MNLEVAGQVTLLPLGTSALAVFFLFLAPVKHHDRALTLVFGSDGQVSLIGFDSRVASQAPYTVTVSNAATPIPGIRSLPGGSSSVLPMPDLEATTPSLTGIAPQTPTSVSSSTSIPSSFASTSYDSSSNATDTDTNLPSIPTVNYPTPSPTPVSNPRDHGVGAPFYLAIVLASISFIGCVAALIAWWIRSRTRKRDLEVDDAWGRSDTISDTGSPSTGSGNAFEKGNETRSNYLSASIVRRNSNLLAVPHTIPNLKAGTSLNGTPHTRQYSSLHDPFPHNSDSEPNPSQNRSSPRTKDPYSRPGTERIQSVLSVQESTRTLGRLRVANRVPGDVTSGDEGGTSVPRSQNSAGLSTIPILDLGAAPGENAIHRTQHGQGDWPLDTPLEPPGPATIPWGRRTGTIAALRRTRRTPGTTVWPCKDPGHDGYPHLVLEGGSTWQVPVATNKDENKDRDNSSSEPLDWKSTLKSSFWQAVDAMTGNRPTDPVSQPVNTGNGSTFTPVPQRVAARRSLNSPTRPAANSTELTPSDNLFGVQEMYQSLAYPSTDSSEARKDEAQVPHISEFTMGSIGSPPPRVSHLNQNLGVATRRPLPDSIKADTGSIYSTDSATARANLRKYGYGDPIPSSWSALGAARESQLDLERSYLPLPGLTPSPSPSLLPTMPSQLALDSSLLSSPSTPAPRQSNMDASTLRLDKTMDLARCGEMKSSMYSTSASRNGTTHSGHGTAGHGTVPSRDAPSATSNMLNRKKGVTTRRKRPILPQRAPSSASSVQSIEGGLSIRELAVRRALLERRQKVKAANSLKGRNDILARNHGAGSSLGQWA